MCMSCDHRKNRVSVSAVMSLTRKRQTAGSVPLAASAEKGAFDSGHAEYVSCCGSNTQSLLKL